MAWLAISRTEWFDEEPESSDTDDVAVRLIRPGCRASAGRAAYDQQPRTMRTRLDQLPAPPGPDVTGVGGGGGCDPAGSACAGDARRLAPAARGPAAATHGTATASTSPGGEALSPMARPAMRSARRSWPARSIVRERSSRLCGPLLSCHKSRSVRGRRRTPNRRSHPARSRRRFARPSMSRTSGRGSSEGIARGSCSRPRV